MSVQPIDSIQTPTVEEGKSYGRENERNDTCGIASDWLRDFSACLVSADSENIASCFLPYGWLRDVLTFTWNNRCLEGQEKISAYLRETLSVAKVSDVELDSRPGLSPELVPFGPSVNAVSSGFTFTTTVAIGQGYFRLLRDEGGEWKALYVFMTIVDLKGYEEKGHEAGVYGGHTLAWEDVNMERRMKVEENPHVLILGAGQTGLNIAARFRQMNIPSIVIETTPRVGDVWRNRYPTLSLHTPRSHHCMLYQSFPKNWPFYTPKDKLADWFEQYVRSQDLIVWTNSRIQPVPSYDFKVRRWTVVVDRNGTNVTLHPAHIVVATGGQGIPNIPDVPGEKIFRGISFHTSKYQGGRSFAGKHVVVLGAGNSSADICQDLAFHGAYVTMVQRSSTCVVSATGTTEIVLGNWPEGVPTEIADFKFAALPLLLLKKLSVGATNQLWIRDAEMYDGLQKAGLRLNKGIDGGGQYSLLLERGGGYWLDVGCAQEIISGKIKIKHGELERFTEDGVVFKDGSSLSADVVIFATGFHSIRHSTNEIFGEETTEQTGHVWGLDHEGELRGQYRPSGHPGLWYGSGDFYHSRFSSKQLALEIKAIELGIMHV